MAENDWIITKPVDHTKIGELPQKVRDVKSSAKIIIAKEHATPATDNAGGQHLKGAARVYLQSGSPSLDPEGNSLDTAATTDDGRIMCDTALSNTLKVFVGTAAGVSTGWEDVRVGRVKLSEDLVGNSKGIGGIASGTVTGQAIHVGQIDTDYLKLNEPATAAALRVHIDTSFIATAHASGLTIRSLSINSSVMSSAGAVMCTPRTITGDSDSNGSVTLPNGCILKWGKSNINANTALNVAHGLSKCFQAFATIMGTDNTTDTYGLKLVSVDDTNIRIRNTHSESYYFRWLVIGR